MFRTTTPFALTAVLALAACGGDDERSATTTTSSAAANGQAARYCKLAKGLDRAGESFFAKLGEDAGANECEAAEREFAERHLTEISALRRAAPPAIAADVRTMLTGMRQRAGLAVAEKVDERKSAKAEERVKAFETRNCAS